MSVIVGVLALQGAFQEHLDLLRTAAKLIYAHQRASQAKYANVSFEFRQVRTEEQLSECDSLIIPGGESTTISLVAARSNLLEPLRDFVK
jgi:pyridoxal 5'-phosphate synthase pdxT subunit